MNTTPWERAAEDGGAARTTLADLGGATVENEAPFPHPTYDWTAEKANAASRECAAHARIVDAATICVEFSGSAPVVVSAIGPGSHVVGGLFTPADNGDGDTTLSWPAGALPVPVARPRVTINGDTVGMHAAEYVTTDGVVTGVRVRTRNGNNAAANLPFTVDVR